MRPPSKQLTDTINRYIRSIEWGASTIVEYLGLSADKRYQARQKSLHFFLLVLGFVRDPLDTAEVASQLGNYSDSLFDDIAHNYGPQPELVDRILNVMEVSLTEDPPRVSVFASNFLDSEKHFEILERLGDEDLAHKYILSIRQCYLLFSDRPGLCLSAEMVYKKIKKLLPNEYESAIECFAGVYNHNLKHWCSLFYQYEKHFGSLGNFFDLEERNPDVFKACKLLVSNPPWVTSFLEHSSAILSRTKKASISIIPDWRSQSSYEHDLNDPRIYPHQKKDPSKSRTYSISKPRCTVPYPAYEMLRESKWFVGAAVIPSMIFTDGLVELGPQPIQKLLVVVLDPRGIIPDGILAKFLSF